ENAKIHYSSRKESRPKYWFVLFQRNSFWVKIQAIPKAIPIPRRNDAIQITRSQWTTRFGAVSRHDDLWRDMGLGRLEGGKQENVRSLCQRGRQLYRHICQLHRWNCRRIPR